MSKNAVYHLQISLLVPEIFKVEKLGRYANEMTDDVIHSTQYYLKHINRSILANRPRSIYQYSSMAPRLSGQNC